MKVRCNQIQVAKRNISPGRHLMTSRSNSGISSLAPILAFLKFLRGPRIFPHTCRLLALGLMGSLLIVAPSIPVHADTLHTGLVSPSVAKSWPMLGYNAAGTLYNPNETILNTSNVRRLVQKWSYATWNLTGSYSSPAVVNGLLYFGAGDLTVTALKANTGVLVWQYYVGAGISSSPAVANGVVYIGGDDGNFYALNAITGALIWKYTTGGTIYLSPTVVNGRVYFGSDDGNLYALSATTGALLWKYATGTVVRNSPAVVNGIVYFAVYNALYALNANTGTLRWMYPVAGLGFDYSNPTVANGHVFFWSMAGSANGTMFSLDAKTGTLIWFYTSSWFAGSQAVANGVLYFCSGGVLNAFNAVNGVPLWSTPAAWDNNTSPTVANGVVYYTYGTLMAADASTGSVLWTASASAPSTPAVVVNGMVYFNGGVTTYGFHLLKA